MSLRNLLPVIALFGAACAARPTSAQFLYDTSINEIGGTVHTEFTEPAILTSFTTVTSFLVNNGTDKATSENLGPTSATSPCPTPGGGSLPGPCLSVINAPGSGSTYFAVSGLPQFTAVGTYSFLFGGTLKISQEVSAVPEPSSIVLLLTSLGAAVFVFRKRLNSRKLSA